MKIMTPRIVAFLLWPVGLGLLHQLEEAGEGPGNGEICVICNDVVYLFIYFYYLFSDLQIYLTDPALQETLKLPTL